MLKFFVLGIIKDLKLSKIEDILNVPQSYIKLRNKRLIQQYENSTLKLISTCFPELNLTVPKKKSHPWGYWKNVDNQRNFLNELATKLNIKDLSDWYTVSNTQIISHGGYGLLNYHRCSLLRMLRTAFPQMNWKAGLLRHPHFAKSGQSSYSKVQYLLFTLVKQIFPSTVCEFNYGFKHQQSSQAGLNYIEFDIFIPEVSLAIEYNGEYHYKSIALFNEVETVMKRDKRKEEICHMHGICVVIIPFWWDRKIESVAKEIHKARPDIILPASLLQGEAIAMQMPQQIQYLYYYPKVVDPT